MHLPSVFCLFFLAAMFAGVSSQPLGNYCPNSTIYAPNSTYRSNLNSLLSALASNATRQNGFYNSTFGRGVSAAYGLFMCRGDVSVSDCRACVLDAGEQILKACPVQTDAVIWYDNCMLRYSKASMFGRSDASIVLIMRNTQNDSQPARFMDSVGNTLNAVAVAAAAGDGSGRKFATLKANFSAFEKIYALGQCTPDLSELDCRSCLTSGIGQLPGCCYSAKGARTVYPSCNVRYEVYPFYDNSKALGNYCPDNKIYAPNSTYRSNLNSLLSALASNATRPSGFYNSTVGGGDSAAYGLFMCRGDVSVPDCHACVIDAGEQILKACPAQTDAVIWYNNCMLRYSNASMFGRADTSFKLNLHNTQNDTQNSLQPRRFTVSLESTLYRMADIAAAGDGSGRKFAVQEANISAFEKIYTLGQCTPDLSKSDCLSCLTKGISMLGTACCYSSLGDRSVFPSCIVRYDVYPFYASTPPPPPSLILVQDGAARDHPCPLEDIMCELSLVEEEAGGCALDIDPKKEVQVTHVCHGEFGLKLLNEALKQCRGGCPKEDVAGRAWYKFMGSGGGDVGVIETSKHAKVGVVGGEL
ncbi:unnamed protein product [Cuscuta campestris]|uniref:Gnk2-homologous domain-containing protein n=1 Tax=Cuscuta campestris TaxID=132261 RepID=A0A484N542_9ASTE|nr:unnamed protein product [Cuscuta campestris]